MKAMFFIVSFLLVVTAATVFNQHQVHDSFSAIYVIVIFFLVLNFLITYWEIILWYKADFIKERSDEFYLAHKEDKSIPMSSFMNSKVTLGTLFSPTYWAGVWVGYSMYDRSYADRKSFGFSVDIGNGLSTIIPCLILHFGFTYHFLDANILGMIMLAVMWQMGYGTLVYWFSFLVNGRHKLLSTGQNIVVIIGSNVPWFIFSCIGLFAAIRLIVDNNFSVFGI